VPVRIDINQIAFGQPEMLFLLAVPALLLVLWGWQLVRRRVWPLTCRAGVWCRCASGLHRSATCRSGCA
jgi:hypothetical protein